jgi:hypothetical protein
MKNEDRKDDILRIYMNPEGIKKAPSEFASDVMRNIKISNAYIKKCENKSHKSKIPAIFVLFTLSLIILTCILTNSNGNLNFSPFMNVIRNINYPNFDNKIDAFLRINLPGWLPYLFIAIISMTFFDKKLDSFFHRQK